MHQYIRWRAVRVSKTLYRHPCFSRCSLIVLTLSLSLSLSFSLSLLRARARAPPQRSSLLTLLVLWIHPVFCGARCCISSSSSSSFFVTLPCFLIFRSLVSVPRAVPFSLQFIRSLARVCVCVCACVRARTRARTWSARVLRDCAHA